MARAHVTLEIYGFGCGGGGALTVERALARVPGVVRAYVNSATEMAYVEFDPNVCTVEQLAKSLGDCGFQSAQGQE